MKYVAENRLPVPKLNDWHKECINHFVEFSKELGFKESAKLQLANRLDLISVEMGLLKPQDVIQGLY